MPTISRAGQVKSWEDLDAFLNHLLRKHRSPEELHEAYRRFIESKPRRKCIVCQVTKGSTRISHILETERGQIAVCFSCAPTTSDQHALQLALFGPRVAGSPYWTIGPNEPPDYDRELPIVPGEKVLVDKTRYEKYMEAKFKREEQQRIQASRHRR